jgi:hypothetical protein
VISRLLLRLGLASSALRGVFPHAGEESREIVARYIMEIGASSRW